MEVWVRKFKGGSWQYRTGSLKGTMPVLYKTGGLKSGRQFWTGQDWGQYRTWSLFMGKVKGAMGVIMLQQWGGDQIESHSEIRDRHLSIWGPAVNMSPWPVTAIQVGGIYVSKMYSYVLYTSFMLGLHSGCTYMYTLVQCTLTQMVPRPVFVLYM